MEKKTKIFQEMNIKKELKSAIQAMGFEEATPIQAEAIPPIIEGNDFIGIAQTGTGKTCAFGIPAIEKLNTKDTNVQILVLCPTRELVIQTGEELQSLSQKLRGVKICTIFGGQPIERQIVALKKKPQIVIGTPGRIMDHMRRKTIAFDGISMFILDEADEMLNMGFREDLDVILKKANPERQTVLFSATMSKDILQITKKYQKKQVVKVEIEHKTLTPPKIEQYRIKVSEDKKVEMLTRIIDSEDTKLAVIFCNTKRKVDALQENLSLRGYQASGLHGDMKQSQRDSVIKRFKNGKVDILIATDVAARGIDVDGIDMIFNYDIPADEEYYVHRIGRTGRAGKEGKAITFVTAKEMYKIRNLEKYTHAVLKEYEVPSAKLVKEKKINDLLETVTREIEQTNMAEEMQLLEEYLQNVEVDALEVAAALLKRTLGKEETSFVMSDKETNDKRKTDKIRLFITLGKLDGFRRSDLREYVCKQAHVSRSDISDVEVLDKFSFVTVKEKVAPLMIEKLDQTKYHGRKVAVEESTKKG